MYPQHVSVGGASAAAPPSLLEETEEEKLAVLRRVLMELSSFARDHISDRACITALEKWWTELMLLARGVGVTPKVDVTDGCFTLLTVLSVFMDSVEVGAFIKNEMQSSSMQRVNEIRSSAEEALRTISHHQQQIMSAPTIDPLAVRAANVSVGQGVQTTADRDRLLAMLAGAEAFYRAQLGAMPWKRAIVVITKSESSSHS